MLNRRKLLVGAGALSMATGLRPEEANAIFCVNNPRVKWPLAGTFNPSKVTLGFGSNWVLYDPCYGQIKIHNGIDYVDPSTTYAGAPVFASSAGDITVLGNDATFGPWITISHGGCSTSVYWHVKPLSTMYSGKVVNQGQQIGNIFDLTTFSQGRYRTHLHWGYRTAPYSNTANRGGLPQRACSIQNDPAFPERFVNPSQMIWV